MEHTRLLLLAAVALLATTPLAAHAQEKLPIIGAPVSTTAQVFDLKALALLERSADRIQAVQSVSGRSEIIVNTPTTSLLRLAGKVRVVATFKLQKPNLLYYEFATQEQSPDGKWTETATGKYVSDGIRGVQFSSTNKTYHVLPVASAASIASYPSQYRELFNPALSTLQKIHADKAAGALLSLTLAPDAVYGGVPCFVVEGKTRLVSDKIYIDKKDGIIRGHQEEALTTAVGATTVSVTITNLAVDKKLPVSVFAFDLTGYKESVSPIVPASPPR